MAIVVEVGPDYKIPVTESVARAIIESMLTLCDDLDDMDADEAIEEMKAIRSAMKAVGVYSRV